MKFDPSGLQLAFQRMEKKAKDHGKELSKDQGDFFLRMTRKISWKSAPTKDELDAVARRLGDKFKLHRGAKTRDQELARRKRMRGLFARKWEIGKVEQAGYRIRIWIVNKLSYAGKIDDRDRSAEKAATIVGGSFKRRLDKMAELVTKSF